MLLRKKLAWKVEFDPHAEKELRKIDKIHSSRIIKFLRTRLEHTADPRSIGEALRGPFKQLWKYRVGDFRIICDIQDDVIKILVLRIAHRRKIYKRFGSR